MNEVYKLVSGNTMIHNHFRVLHSQEKVGVLPLRAQSC